MTSAILVCIRGLLGREPWNHDARSRRQAVILSQEPLYENALRAAIDAACYTKGVIFKRGHAKRRSRFHS